MLSTEIKSALASMSEAEIREVKAYLHSLTLTKEDREEFDRKVEDKNPAHWVRGEDLDRALGLEDSQK